MFTVKGKAANGQTIYIKQVDSACLCKWVKHAFTIQLVVTVEVSQADAGP